MNNFQENTESMIEGAVTLLDILGWKGIWQRKADAVDALLELIENVTNKSEDVLENRARYQGLKTDVKSISDTIALVTYGECDLSLEFQAGISGIIIRESILKGIPVRGATSYGYLTTKKNIMVGPAIDEVASWYEMADWIGVFLTPSALLRSTHKYKYSVLIQCEVPIKQYSRYKSYCVNWISNWKVKKLTINHLKESFLASGPITPSIASKFFNTLDFYQYVYKERKYDFDSSLNEDGHIT